MMEVACQCEEGAGAYHTHIPEKVVCCWEDDESKEFTIAVWDFELNPSLKELRRIPPSIRIWVDWKAVAKALAQG